MDNFGSAFNFNSSSAFNSSNPFVNHDSHRQNVTESDGAFTNANIDDDVSSYQQKVCINCG